MAGVKGQAPEFRGRIPKKLSEAQVAAIRYHYAGVGHNALARMFGVSETLVRRIRKQERWVRRASDRGERIAYQPPPVEVIERQDLDVWFIRRGAALLRGYATALEKLKKEGRFEEPKPEEWQVDDEFGRDGFATDTRTRAKRLAERARKYLQEQGSKSGQQPGQDQGGQKQRAGKPDVSDLLYDPKG